MVGSLHQDHRKRIRSEILDFGMEHMEDYKILEAFLYTSLARGDTNELAHRIIEHFGSIDMLMEANADELMEVPGIGEQIAVQIITAMELFRRCMRTRVTRLNDTQNVYDTVQKIAERMWTYFQGLENERLYMLAFDNRMALISQRIISNGAVNTTELSGYGIIEWVIRKRGANVVLVHNHPHGSPIPSPEDLDVTNEMECALKYIGIPLREHIIIADDCFSSIMRSHNHFPHLMAAGKVSDGGFDWGRFYNVDEETYRFSNSLPILPQNKI